MGRALVECLIVLLGRGTGTRPYAEQCSRSQESSQNTSDTAPLAATVRTWHLYGYILSLLGTRPRGLLCSSGPLLRQAGKLALLQPSQGITTVCAQHLRATENRRRVERDSGPDSSATVALIPVRGNIFR